MGRWYAGVVHSHTTRSDGIYTPEQLIRLAEKKNLDFIILTDHNQFCESVPESKKMLVIPGTELTKHGGHTNIWGVQYPIDNFECEEYEEWERKIAMAKEKGAVICINHPWCSNCTWRWPLEPEKADCVEVWNSPQHTDNITCTNWWRGELAKGKKIPAVGGSDYHRDYFVTDFLDNPVTYVYAEECTQQAILDAIKAGHTTVSPHVGSTRIELVCGDKIIGDTVKLIPDTKVTVKVSNIKKGHTLKVFDRQGVCFEYTAEKAGPFAKVLPVRDTNFMCAQTEYVTGKVFNVIYGVAAKAVLHEKPGEIPPFIDAQTGAIYFE